MPLQDVAAGGRCGIQNQSDFCIAIAVFTSKTKPDPFQSCDYECAQRPKSNSVIYGCANSFQSELVVHLLKLRLARPHSERTSIYTLGTSQLLAEIPVKYIYTPSVSSRQKNCRNSSRQTSSKTSMIAETTLWLNPFYKPPYVTDGMKHGIPSRFINHSREPNCRIFTISQNHADTRIYDIPFFTLHVSSTSIET